MGEMRPQTKFVMAVFESDIVIAGEGCSVKTRAIAASFVSHGGRSEKGKGGKHRFEILLSSNVRSLVICTLLVINMSL